MRGIDAGSWGSEMHEGRSGLRCRRRPFAQNRPRWLDISMVWRMPTTMGTAAIRRTKKASEDVLRKAGEAGHEEDIVAVFLRGEDDL